MRWSVELQGMDVGFAVANPRRTIESDNSKLILTHSNKRLSSPTKAAEGIGKSVLK